MIGLTGVYSGFIHNIVYSYGQGRFDITPVCFYIYRCWMTDSCRERCGSPGVLLAVLFVCRCVCVCVLFLFKERGDGWGTQRREPCSSQNQHTHKLNKHTHLADLHYALREECKVMKEGSLTTRGLLLFFLQTNI